MTIEKITHAILSKLDLVYQKTAMGDLANAFQLIEEVDTLINTEKSDAEQANKSELEEEFFNELVHLHASLRRKLLKEMAKGL
jgi:hypothetical protein